MPVTKRMQGTQSKQKQFDGSEFWSNSQLETDEKPIEHISYNIITSASNVSYNEEYNFGSITGVPPQKFRRELKRPFQNRIDVVSFWGCSEWFWMVPGRFEEARGALKVPNGLECPTWPTSPQIPPLRRLQGPFLGLGKLLMGAPF